MWNFLKRLFGRAQGAVDFIDSLDELGDAGKQLQDIGRNLVELTHDSLVRGGITDAQRLKAHSENAEATQAVDAYIDSLPRRK